MPTSSGSDASTPFVVPPAVALLLIALCLSLSSCLCSWKPDVGPVEDEESAAVEKEMPFEAPFAVSVSPATGMRIEEPFAV